MIRPNFTYNHLPRENENKAHVDICMSINAHNNIIPSDPMSIAWQMDTKECGSSVNRGGMLIHLHGIV